MKNKSPFKKAAHWLQQRSSRTTAIIFWLSIIGIGLSILHYLTAENMNGAWYVVHMSLRRFYFLPVLVAALLAGKRGAFVVAVVVTTTYVPYLIFHWSGTLAGQSENISDIGLLWLVGLLAGYLSDRLKRSHADKARLVAVENLSGAFGLVLNQMQVDYEAGLGLSRAIGQQIKGGGEFSFTAKILEQRLDHLGYHLGSLRRIIGSGDVVKKRKNLAKIIAKGIENMETNGAVILLHKQGRIPHLYLDEDKIQFAITQFIHTMLKVNKAPERINIKLAKNNNSANLIIEENRTAAYRGTKTDTAENYQLSLALAIIKTHGGTAEMIKPDGRLLAVNITLPVC